MNIEKYGHVVVKSNFANGIDKYELLTKTIVMMFAL